MDISQDEIYQHATNKVSKFDAQPGLEEAQKKHMVERLGITSQVKIGTEPRRSNRIKGLEGSNKSISNKGNIRNGS
jgi:hypothetical protein